MKHKTLFTVILLLLAQVVCARSNSHYGEIYHTYVNPFFRFSIDFDSNWQTLGNADYMLKQISRHGTTLVAAARHYGDRGQLGFAVVVEQDPTMDAPKIMAALNAFPKLLEFSGAQSVTIYNKPQPVTMGGARFIGTKFAGSVDGQSLTMEIYGKVDRGFIFMIIIFHNTQAPVTPALNDLMSSLSFW